MFFTFKRRVESLFKAAFYVALKETQQNHIVYLICNQSRALRPFDYFWISDNSIFFYKWSNIVRN